MSFINNFPYPIYIGILIIFIIGLIWSIIKGYDQFRTEHLILPAIEGIISSILLIILRTIKEFKIFTPMQSPIFILTMISFAILMINVFVLAIPKLRYDHYHRNKLIFYGILLLICICFCILAYKFPDFFNAPFKGH
jgi:archaellum biogenesis protein FlaJ (TadC family)